MQQKLKKMMYLFLCSFSIVIFSQSSNPCRLSGFQGKQPEALCEMRDFFRNVKNILDPKVRVTSSLMLSGPSGTGKTTAAVVFADEAEVEKRVYAAQQILDPEKDSVEVLKKIYQDADEYVEKTGKPIILIFDGFEYPTDSNENSSLHRNQVYTMHTFKSESEDRFGNPRVITVVTTTNWLKFSKPIRSRFSAVFFKLPDREDRLKMIQDAVQRHHVPLSQTSAWVIALLSKGVTWRDIDRTFGDIKCKKSEGLTFQEKLHVLYQLSKQNYVSMGIGCLTSIATIGAILYGIHSGKLSSLIKFLSFQKSSTKPSETSVSKNK